MEKEFVRWLRERSSKANSNIVVGIGDDAGILRCEKQLVVATDSIAESTHFDLSLHSLTQVGHKAIAVNLSDIAAMGAKPYAATVNMLCPKNFDLSCVQELYTGMEKTATDFNTIIFGGDTNRWDGKLVVSATVFGEKLSDQVVNGWRISNARPGEAILVSGNLGGSILRKHIEFEPRVALAEYLANKYQVSAATDVTDSLAIDLAEIANQSEVGFSIEADLLPISADARELSKNSGRTALEHALYDGEDFELVFSTSTDTAKKICADENLPVAVAQIGRFTDERVYQMLGLDSQKNRLDIQGYEH